VVYEVVTARHRRGRGHRVILPIVDAMRTGDVDRARAVLAAHMATAADVWGPKAETA
jgi:DNA-binding GntR family transcriptional regulator